MIKRNSLQYRLSIGLTLLFSAFLILASAGAAWVMRHEMNELLDSSIVETAQRILPLAVVEIINRDPADPGSGDLSKSIMSLAEHDEHLTYLIINAHNEVLLQSHNARPDDFDLQHQDGFMNNPSHRVYATSAVSGSYRILIAESLVHRQHALWEALLALLWPVLVLVPLCFLGVWYFVRNKLQHVNDYRNAVMARNSHHLEPIHLPDLPEELLSISESVNHLILTLNAALSAQRSFTENSAHELRTPIATALAQLQHLKHKLSDPEAIVGAEGLEHTLKEQARLSEKLMQLAKAEGGSLISSQAENLVPVLALLVQEYQRKTAIPLRLELPESGSVTAKIDVDAFAILLRNLVENAIKYALPESGIDIRFSQTGELSISNDCPVLAAEVLERLQERFVRAATFSDATNSDTTKVYKMNHGHGLGLAIVSAIVQGVGATLTLYSPARNLRHKGSTSGFEISIVFKLAA